MNLRIDSALHRRARHRRFARVGRRHAHRRKSAAALYRQERRRGGLREGEEHVDERHRRDAGAATSPAPSPSSRRARNPTRRWNSPASEKSKKASTAKPHGRTARSQGPRVLEGDEKARSQTRRHAFADHRLARSLQRGAHRRSEDIDGKPAWKVEMTPKEGKPETFFFDRDSGLLVRISAVHSTPPGRYRHANPRCPISVRSMEF